MKYLQIFQSLSRVVLVSNLAVVPIALPIIALAEPMNSYQTTRHNLMKHRSTNSDRDYQSTSSDRTREQINNSTGASNNQIGRHGLPNSTSEINNSSTNNNIGANNNQIGRHGL